MYRKLILFGVGLIISTILFGQEQEQEKFKAFRGTSLINLKTTENVAKKGFNFVIQHQFGQASLQEDLLRDFFGMDLTSNIRFGFVVPLSRSNYIGIGRTKFNKNYDFEFKQILLKQSPDKRIPLSVALYFNGAISTTDFPGVQPDNYFGDGTTPFEYKFLHRTSYISQLIISKKFGRRFSLLVSPSFVHHNLVDQGEYNKRWVLPFGAEIRTGMFSSIIFEYAHMFDNYGGRDNPYGIGWEFQSASHLFQIFVSNKNNILSQNYLMNPIGADFGNKTFFLGFNLHRTFWVKKQ